MHSAWPLWEGSGRRIYDALRQLPSEAFSGGLSWVPGPSGPALDLPGSDDYVDLPWYPIPPFTIVHAVRYDAFGSTVNRLMGSVSGTNSRRAYVGVYDTSPFCMMGVGDDYKRTVASGIVTGQWCIIALTAGNGTARYYLDGVQKDSMSYTWTGGVATDAFRLGEAVNGTGDIDGALGWIYLYDCELTAAEIRQLVADPYAMWRRPSIMQLFGAIPPVPGVNDFSWDGTCAAVWPLDSRTAGTGIVASASSEKSASDQAWEAFNIAGGGSAWYSAGSEMPCWVALSFGAGREKVIQRYGVLSPYLQQNRAPKDWKFQGYNGLSWVDLDTQSDQTGWPAFGETRYFNFSNTTAYEAYRLYITANNGDTYTGVGELYLYSTDGITQRLDYAMTQNTHPAGTSADAKESNDLIVSGDANLPSEETTDYQEGSGCLDFVRASEHQYGFLPDNKLSSIFPLKYGSSNKSFSIAMRLKIDNLNSYSNWLWTKGGTDRTTATGFYIWGGTGAATLEVKCVSGTLSITSPSSTFAAGTWYFVAMTYDDVSGVLRLYVYDLDGSSLLYNSTVTKTTQGEIELNRGDFILAGYYIIHITPHEWDFDGKLDEVVVFNRALSVLEIELIRDGDYTAQFTASIVATSSMSASLTAVAFAPLVGQWTWPVRERLIFNTEILQSHDRTEQRIAHRSGIPQQVLATKVLCKGEGAVAEFEAVQHRWLDWTWPVPLWPQAVRHTPDLPAGSSAIAIDTTTGEFRADSWVMIWQSHQRYEIVKVSSVAAGALTLGKTTVQSYSGAKWVIPCRLGWVLALVRAERYAAGALYEMALTVDVSDLAAVTGYSAPMTYDGYTVLTEPGHWDGDHGRHTHDPDTTVAGGVTGPFVVVANADYPENTVRHGWDLDTPAACWSLRQFLHDVKGRQTPFLRPTFREDITLTRPIGSGATELYVANGRFASAMGLNALRTYLAFRPAGASIIPRKVTAIDAVSETEEKITINTAPGVAFGPGSALCWIDLCRLTNDEVQIEWHKRNTLTCVIPLTKVSG